MNARAFPLLCALLLLPAVVSAAEKAYTWTDANGTRHFSEDPPNDGQIKPVQIELQPAPSAGNVGEGDDFYSVVNQANRMERNRLDNEKRGSGNIRSELELQRAARELGLRLAPLENNAGNQSTGNKPAYPLNTSNRQTPASYGRPLQARPGGPGPYPEYAPMYPPGN